MRTATVTAAILALLPLTAASTGECPPAPANVTYWTAQPGEWPDTNTFGNVPAGHYRLFTIDSPTVSADAPIRYRVTIEKG